MKTAVYTLLITLLCGLSPTTNAQRYIPLISDEASVLDGQHGPDAAVCSMISYNNKLLFTGRFSNINGNETMPFAATWDGESFAPIQPSLPEITGTSGILDALNSPLGLVLSGRMADLNNIIVISGNEWTTLGEGFDDTVFDVIWFNNQLYASGRFMNSGATPTPYVARWNGNSWEAVDGGMDGNVYDLEVYNNQLYAVGAFSMAGSQECSRIARLSGSAWESVGDGFSDDAYCISLIDDELYIGGAFDTDASGENNFYGLCAYDGTNFSALHSGPETFDVASIVELDNSVIVSERGPQFTSFLTKTNSKRLINNNLEDLDPSWPRIHQSLTWNSSIYVSSYNAEIGESSTSFYLNNALFKYAPKGKLNEFISTDQVRALVYPSASLFNDLPNSDPAFFVGNDVPPVSTIFSASPWISAYTSDAETLYINNQSYGGETENQEYYFGPFSDLYDTEYLEKYLQVWSLSAEEVETHIDSFNETDYSAPDAILTWPGNGRTAFNESLHLAPFEDTNMNGLYEPSLGDYPVIRGDRCLFYILSADREDVNNMDTGMELMVMLYAFDETPETVFLNYQLNNTSNNDYEQVKFGFWTDGDIGNSGDDFFGSSPENNFYYFYNGDAFDEAGISSPGFGDNPPMQAISFLNRNMSNCLSYNNSVSPINGNPDLPEHFDNYLNSIWKDNSVLLYGGNGFDPGTGADPDNPTPFMYPSAPNLAPGDGIWNENGAGNIPGDRRAVASFESLPLAMGETLSFDIAFVSASPNEPLENPADNFDNLVETNDEAVNLFEEQEFNIPITFPVGLNDLENLGETDLLLYPNPASTALHISNPKALIQTVIINDLQGKVVFQSEGLNHAQVIDITKLNAGIYFVHALYENGSMDTQKLIKK